MPLRRTTPLLPVAVVVLVALVGWLFGTRINANAAPAAAATIGTTTDDQRARDGLLISGRGEVTGRPDTLRADFGTEAQGVSVDEALGKANRALERIRRALLRRGVAKADLQTTGIDIYPRYDDDSERVTGYQASQQLRVTFRDLRRAGRMLGAAVSAGGDAARLSGLSFSIEDDEARLTDARRRAFADAHAKAELYAGAAGRDLARVVSVTETVRGAGPRPRYVSGLADARAYKALDVAVEPGADQLRVTVTVEWAFR